MTTSNSTRLVSRTVSAPRTPTWWRWVAVGIVAVLAAAVVAVVGDEDTGPPRTTAPTAVARRPLLLPLPTAASQATAAGVARAVVTALHDPAFGGHVTGAV